MGLPVAKLVCASNANNVLTDLLETGVYDRRRELKKTTSPSMDILVSSNLERLLYLETEDAARVRGWMEELKEKGVYTLDPALQQKLREKFWAAYSTDKEVADTIRQVYREEGYLCDPHTAAGWAAARRYRVHSGDERPMVVLSTASPYKFSEAVLAALEVPAAGDEFARMEALQELSGVEIPHNLAGLKAKPERHSRVIGKEEMLPFVLGL